MSGIQTFRRRPWLTTACAVAALAIGLLVVPVSYERTSANDVSLTLSGVQDPSRIGDIAKELKSALSAEHVLVKASALNGVTTYTLESSIPAKLGDRTAATAQAFAKNLSQRGFSATAQVVPKKERVAGSVYAYTMDRVIQINVGGKTAAAVENEIRQKLAEAGITDAQVSVTDEGSNGRKIKVEARKHLEAGKPQNEHSPLQIQFTKDGKPLQGEGFTVRVMKRKAGAETTLLVEVNNSGKSATAEVRNPEGMSDAALAAEVRSQLQRAGFDVRVEVTNGRIEILRNP